MTDTFHFAPRQLVRAFSSEQLIAKFDDWLMVTGRCKNTRIAYVYAARSFAKTIIGKPITATTKDDVRLWLDQLYTANLAAATISNRLDSLRTFFDFLQLGDQVSVCVPRHILRRKLPKRLPHALSVEQVEKVIQAAESVRDRAILELLYASGLRLSECAHLRVEHVSLQEHTLIVRAGKGGKDRIAFFGQEAADAIEDYLGYRKSPGPLFLADDEERYEGGLVSRSIYRIVKRAAQRAGIPDVSPHTLRHSFATHLLNRGVDVRFVMELLGHSSMSTTAKYLHVAIDRLQKVHELLERSDYGPPEENL